MQCMIPVSNLKKKLWFHTFLNKELGKNCQKFVWACRVGNSFAMTKINFVGLTTIESNLKTSKKWNTQGSWNGTIILINTLITKVVCFKCYNHKSMACNN